MLEKLLQKDLNTRFFYGMIITIWSVIIFYAAFFAYFNAWGASATMLFGIFVIMPVVCFLEYKRHHVTSRLVYNLSTSFYVFMAGLCFQFQDSSQYYYSCVVIGAMLIFSKKDIKAIAVALFAVFAFWMGSKLLPMDMVPVEFLAQDAPMDFIRTFNEIGSFFLTIFFMYMFVMTIGYLKEETISMNDLILRTEEDAKIGSWAYDTVNNTLKWSDQTYRIHEVEIGSTLDVEKAIEFYHVDDRERITQYFTKAVESGVPFNDVFRIITTTGKQTWVRSRGRVARDEHGNIIEVAGSFQDIMEEKQAQDAKDEFLATISHEMRTPLMSVIGLSDLLKESPLNKEQKEHTDAIIDGGNAVLTIINDVLDLSKINDKSLNLILKNTDLKEVVHGACNVLQHFAIGKDLKFEYNCVLQNQFIHCDSVRLRQIITNLVSNAIKFTDEGSVKISVTEKQNSNDSSSYVFNIEDTGCGMSEDFVPKIFDEFLQEEHEGDVKVGTGLGMSITKNLVELMGGKISVTSQKDIGTTVSFEIEFKHGTIIEHKKVSTSEVDFSDVRLLYADDNLINQKVVFKLLKSTACQVTFIDNGKEALEEYMQDQNYDLILMDMQMPVMDGLEATKKIREFESTSNLETIPILAFSAFSFEEDIEKAKAAGCQDYIYKPVRKQELIEKIMNWQNQKNKAA